MRARILWVGAAAMIGAIALGAVLVARGAGETTPTGDIAVIESYTIRAAGGHLLVGPYSRFQWHHPGPAYFYWLAPFYAAAHGLTAGLSAAAFVLAFGALALIAALSLTAGRPATAVAVTAVLTAYLLRASTLFTSAWNPHAVVLPLALTIVAAAAAVSTSEWFFAIAALSASVVTQTHIGTVPAALVVTGLAAALLAFERKWKGLAAAALVAAVAWAPALVEQATASGNLSAIWTFFASDTTRGQPFRTAVAAWAGMLVALVRPEFPAGGGGVLRISHSPVLQALAVGELALLAAAGAVAFKRGRRFEAALALLGLAASLVALWSVTRIEGDVMGYEILWMSALGALNAGLATGVLFGPWLSARISGLAAAWTCAAMLAVCAAAGFSALWGVRARSQAPDPQSVSINRAALGIRDYLRDADVHRPFIEIDQASWPLAAGVLLQLQKAGVSYAVPDDWLPMFTEDARATGREAQALSIAGAERHVVIRGRPGVVPVVDADPIYVDALGHASATAAPTVQQSAPITK